MSQAYGDVVLEESEILDEFVPGGFEPNLEWVGVQEYVHVQMDMTAAEVSGVALRSECLRAHELETMGGKGVDLECR